MIKIIAMLFLICTSSARMMEFQCSSTSDCGNTACPSGQEPMIMCPYTFDPLNPDPRCDICAVECARECARETTCLYNCDDCCNGYCNRYSGYELYACEGMCLATCRGNSEFCQMIRLLQFLSIGLGVILLSINAIRWMMSDSDKGRNDAKKGIAYTMFALLIITIATHLVEYFYIGTIAC